MKAHKYRISDAAVGKILTRVMEMTRSSEISPEQFHDTMFAVLNYIEEETEPSRSADINPQKWQLLKEQIDKSARRSRAARERAARRSSLIAASRREVRECLDGIGPSVSSETQLPGGLRKLSYSELPFDPYRVNMPAVPPRTPLEKAEHERNMQIARDFKEMCRRIY